MSYTEKSHAALLQEISLKKADIARITSQDLSAINVAYLATLAKQLEILYTELDKLAKGE